MRDSLPAEQGGGEGAFVCGLTAEKGELSGLCAAEMQEQNLALTDHIEARDLMHRSVEDYRCFVFYLVAGLKFYRSSVSRRCSQIPMRQPTGLCVWYCTFPPICAVPGLALGLSARIHHLLRRQPSNGQETPSSLPNATLLLLFTASMLTVAVSSHFS